MKISSRVGYGGETYDDREQRDNGIRHGDAHAFRPQVTDENCPERNRYDRTQ